MTAETSSKANSGSKTVFPLGPAALSASTKTLEWLIHPREVSQFVDAFNQGQPLQVSRPAEPDYYAGLVTRQAAEKKAGEAQVISSAETKFSWLHALCERLENFTHSVWTAQLLLPPFADQEFSGENMASEAWSGVAVLQISGASEISGVFTEPLTLASGSFLFVPGDRPAKITCEDVQRDSLVLILRFGKNESFADLISLVLPKLLTAAAAEDGDFRKCPPLGWLGRTGRCLTATRKRKREETSDVKSRISDLVNRLLENFLDVEELADELSAEFIAERLPPAPRKSETSGGGKTFGPDPRTAPVTGVRWRNPAWVRVAEGKDEASDDVTLIFASVENKLSRRTATAADEEPEPLTLEIPGKMAAPLAQLFENYPQFAGAGALGPAVLTALWDAGLVETETQKQQM